MAGVWKPHWEYIKPLKHKRLNANRLSKSRGSFYVDKNRCLCIAENADVGIIPCGNVAPVPQHPFIQWHSPQNLQCHLAELTESFELEGEEEDMARACERRIFTDIVTGNNVTRLISCPEWVADSEFRLPSFCCGSEGGERKCCDWSTFVVNRIGFGRTGAG